MQQPRSIRIREKPLKHLCIVLVLASGLAAVGVVSQAEAQSEAAAYDFLIQKVCVDKQDKALSVDPYACPKVDSLRSVRPGEPLPYQRYDQAVMDRPDALQRHDSYPVLLKTGREVVVHPFDYAPFGQFNSERDGFDLVVVRDGWASIAETRSGPRKGATTFFGTGCRPYGGWVLFPVSSFQGSAIAGGQTYAPLQAVHWEALQQPAPGVCPANLSTGTLTTWQALPAFTFGSGNARLKTMPAIRS